MTVIRKSNRFEMPTRTFVGLLIPEKLVTVPVRLDNIPTKKLKLTPETRMMLAKLIIQEEKTDVIEGTGRLFSPLIFPGEFNEKKWNPDLIAQRLNDFNHVAGVVDWEMTQQYREETGIGSKTYILLSEYEPENDIELQRVFERYEGQ